MKISILKQAKNVLFKKNMLPVYVILYITSRCNLKCSHCFFHKSLNKPEEIPLKEIEKISKSMPSLIHVSLTGGEPFLREDIDKIAALFAKNSSVKIISIPTNGTFTEKIVAKATKMAEENPDIIFNISVSIDGTEKIHNQIRGSKNAFSNACKTLAKLLELKIRFKNLKIGVIYTISEDNAQETMSVYKKMLSDFDINQFQINFLRGEPKNARKSKETIEQYMKVNKEIATDLAKKKYKGHQIFGDFYTCLNKRYKQVILKTLKENKFQLPCYAATTNCIIYSNGNVFACEIRQDLFLGNLKNFDFNLKKLLSTKENRKIAKSIRESKCFCTFECQLTSNVAFNATELLKVLLQWIRLKLQVGK